MTSVRHRHARALRGFTLLEILVASAVAAIVLLAVQTVYFGALRLTNTTQARTDREMMQHRTLDLVRRDLSGLMLPGGLLGGQLQTTPETSLGQDVAGERVSPEFYTTSGRIDGWNPFSEVQMVTYYLAPATDGSANRSLVRVVTRNLLPAQTLTARDQDQQVLLEGVAEAGFEFYDGTSWTETWDSTGGSLTAGTDATTSAAAAAASAAATAILPTAIRFRLLLAAPSANLAGQSDIAPIELVVPVAVTTVASQQAQTTAATGGSTP